ncbi:MAG: hypothetical protein ACJA08_000058 [Cyclobacteriaceae bacterium]|jgi:hypothetical protein
MATKTIYLKLDGAKPNYQLQWSYDNVTWAKVTATNPTTEVDSDDELDWDADDSIGKIKINFTKGNIIPNSGVTGNDTKKPKGKALKNLAKGLSDAYTIKVQPAGGGGLEEYDPKVSTPPPGDNIGL